VLALLHPNDLIYCVGLETDWFELQFERCKEGVPICEGHLAFGERLYVGSGLYSCIFDHERKGQGDHFMDVEQSGSICTLHLLALGILEHKTIFVCVDPNTKGASEQLGRL
jgi:hypothetical protein